MSCSITNLCAQAISKVPFSNTFRVKKDRIVSNFSARCTRAKPIFHLATLFARRELVSRKNSPRTSRNRSCFFLFARTKYPSGKRQLCAFVSEANIFQCHVTAVYFLDYL